MAKKKKTKKQKILSDLRRVSTQSIAEKPDFPVYSIPVQKTASQNTPSINPSMINAAAVKTSVIAADYRYLNTDLRRTIFLTISIVIAELAIKFIAKI